jgi:hypothetical protein
MAGGNCVDDLPATFFLKKLLRLHRQEKLLKPERGPSKRAASELDI